MSVIGVTLWSVFSRIRTECGEIRVFWMRENTDQNNSEYGRFRTQCSPPLLPCELSVSLIGKTLRENKIKKIIHPSYALPLLEKAYILLTVIVEIISLFLAAIDLQITQIKKLTFSAAPSNSNLIIIKTKSE